MNRSFWADFQPPLVPTILSLFWLLSLFSPITRFIFPDSIHPPCVIVITVAENLWLFINFSETKDSLVMRISWKWETDSLFQLPGSLVLLTKPKWFTNTMKNLLTTHMVQYLKIWRKALIKSTQSILKSKIGRLGRKRLLVWNGTALISHSL